MVLTQALFKRTADSDWEHVVMVHAGDNVRALDMNGEFITECYDYNDTGRLHLELGHMYFPVIINRKGDNNEQTT
jgi:hypothetical protein